MALAAIPRARGREAVTRIHAALCVLCGLPIKRQGEVVPPGHYPYSMAGFHDSDRAHLRCAAAEWAKRDFHTRAGAEESFSVDSFEEPS